MQQSLAGVKSSVKAQVEVLTGGGLNMLQYVPVMGLDGNPSMMAFLGGMQGMPMGLPPVSGSPTQRVASRPRAAARSSVHQCRRRRAST